MSPTISLSGELFVGGERVRSSLSFAGIDARIGQPLQPLFHEADTATVERACELAWSAFAVFRKLDIEARARFLDTIADQILALGEELLNRAAAESGLPLARLTGERARTMNQLKLFAVGWGYASIRRCLVVSRCRAQTCVNTWYRLARWRYLAPAISHWPSPLPAAIPQRRWPPVVR